MSCSRSETPLIREPGRQHASLESGLQPKKFLPIALTIKSPIIIKFLLSVYLPCNKAKRGAKKWNVIPITIPPIVSKTVHLLCRRMATGYSCTASSELLLCLVAGISLHFRLLHFSPGNLSLRCSHVLGRVLHDSLSFTDAEQCSQPPLQFQNPGLRELHPVRLPANMLAPGTENEPSFPHGPGGCNHGFAFS